MIINIILDAGYPSSPYTMRPYDEPEIHKLPRPEQLRRRAFNKKLSSARITVEHSFGLLKGRFPALQDLGDVTNVEDVYRFINALMVLHNMCVDHGDRPEDIPGFDTFTSSHSVPHVLTHVPSYGHAIPSADRIPEGESDEHLRQLGLQMRNVYLNMLVPRTI